MRILGLDHLVLTVGSVEKTVAFYSSVLGFQAEEAGGRWSLKFGQQKINLHQVDQTFEPKAAHPTPGSGDLCFVTDTPAEETMRRLQGLGIWVEEGPVVRQGAQGSMSSVYFRDPDNNLLEVARYEEASAARSE
jgi:catechol 2,3-dioxygenase-like lactoylglutathione lyase family enzyme